MDWALYDPPACRSRPIAAHHQQSLHTDSHRLRKPARSKPQQRTPDRLPTSYSYSLRLAAAKQPTPREEFSLRLLAPGVAVRVYHPVPTKNGAASHQRRGSAGHPCSLIWNKGRKVRVAVGRQPTPFFPVGKKLVPQALPMSWTDRPCHHLHEGARSLSPQTAQTCIYEHLAERNSNNLALGVTPRDG